LCALVSQLVCAQGTLPLSSSRLEEAL